VAFLCNKQNTELKQSVFLFWKREKIGIIHHRNKKFSQHLFWVFFGLNSVFSAVYAWCFLFKIE